MPAVGTEIDIGLAIIGREIRRCRHDLWMSQQGLANASGVSQSIISRLENGTLTSLRLIRLAAIVAALAGYGPRAEGMQPSRIRLDFIRPPREVLIAQLNVIEEQVRHSRAQSGDANQGAVHQSIQMDE